MVPPHPSVPAPGGGNEPDAQLTCDGQTVVNIESNDRIVIHKHASVLRLIHPPGYDYYATLRAKLHWAREL